VATEHGFVVGDGRQRIAPVLADDVAAVVAAIDDRRDPVRDVWGLAGPDELTADEIFALLGEGDTPEHVGPDVAAPRLTELLEVPVSVRAAEVLAAASVADAPDAAAAFGVDPTPFVEGLRRTVERASQEG
jgi:nucleoside-diphosphate-sugar epimerase